MGLSAFASARRGLASAGLTLAMALASTAALAQSADCARLQQQIASVGSGNPAEAQKYTAAAQRQRVELDRTEAYAQSIGCGRRQFLFFGDPPPAQCPGLEQRIGRMKSNYEQLLASARQFSGQAQRDALQARYDAQCRAQRGPRNFFETLFGGDRGEDMRQEPIGPGDGAPPETVPGQDVPRGGSKAVCVRTCDGGFFPVSYSASGSNLSHLAELCQAQCPNAQTELFTYSPGADIDSAVSVSGQPYKSLPNADKFRTKYDPTCTCKPANESWAQALGNAEKLLGNRDTIVTPERAEEMSRPQAAPPAGKPGAKLGPKARAAAARRAASPPVDAAETPAGPTVDATNASGLDMGHTATSTNVGAGEGSTRSEVGPDGVKRTVRVVGPQP